MTPRVPRRPSSPEYSWLERESAERECKPSKENVKIIKFSARLRAKVDAQLAFREGQSFLGSQPIQKGTEFGRTLKKIIS